MMLEDKMLEMAKDILQDILQDIVSVWQKTFPGWSKWSSRRPRQPSKFTGVLDPLKIRSDRQHGIIMPRIVKSLASIWKKSISPFWLIKTQERMTGWSGQIQDVKIFDFQISHFRWSCLLRWATMQNFNPIWPQTAEIWLFFYEAEMSKTQKKLLLLGKRSDFDENPHKTSLYQ